MEHSGPPADSRGRGRTPAGLEQHVVAALGHRRGAQRRRVDEITRIHAGRVQRAAQRGECAGVEIGRHRDDRVDAFGDAQRVQVDEHLAGHVARCRLVAAELAPVIQRHLVRTAACNGQRGGTGTRFARGGLDRQRLAREQLAIACDGERVVIEVDAVHGNFRCQMLVGKLTLESALYCRSGGSSSSAIPSYGSLSASSSPVAPRLGARGRLCAVGWRGRRRGVAAGRRRSRAFDRMLRRQRGRRVDGGHGRGRAAVWGIEHGRGRGHGGHRGDPDCEHAEEQITHDPYSLSSISGAYSGAT